LTYTQSVAAPFAPSLIGAAGYHNLVADEDSGEIRIISLAGQGGQSGLSPQALQSLRGLPGLDGADGDPGLLGPPGPRGLAGIQGSSGAPGLEGESAEPSAPLFPSPPYLWTVRNEYVLDEDCDKTTITWNQWNSSGATYYGGGTGTNPGYWVVDSSGTANGYSGLFNAAGSFALAAKETYLLAILQPNNDSASNTEIIVGWTDKTSGSGDPNNGLFFQYLKATSANWLCRTASGGSIITSTGSGVAVTFSLSPYTVLEIVGNLLGTAYEFRINGVTVATHSASLPTAALHFTVFVKNGGLNQFTNVQTDKLYMRIRGLTR